jgi:hypothetical protein
MVITHCLVNVSDRKGSIIPGKQREVLIVIGCPKNKRVGRHEVLAVERRRTVIEQTKEHTIIDPNKIVGFRQIKDPRPKSERGGNWEIANPMQ